MMATRTKKYHVTNVLQWRSNAPAITELVVIILALALVAGSVVITARPVSTTSANRVEQVFQQDAARYEALAAHYLVQHSFEQDAIRYEAMAADYRVQRAFEQDAARYEAMALHYWRGYGTLDVKVYKSK